MLIGCDPEAFLVNPSDNTYFPAVDVIPGTKEKPHKIKGGAVQVDGLAVEFNIDPAATLDEWMNNVEGVVQELERMVQPYNLDFTPVALFQKKLLSGIAKDKLKLGCDPDWNAYEGELNPIPTPPDCLRTAAGHIHIGYSGIKQPGWDDQFELTKHLDACLFVPSMYWDSDNPRRQQFYGAVGSMRPKGYGIEYRVLSSKWVQDPLLWEFVYKQTKWATDYFFNEGSLADKFGLLKEMGAQAAIETLHELGGESCPDL